MSQTDNRDAMVSLGRHFASLPFALLDVLAGAIIEAMAAFQLFIGRRLREQIESWSRAPRGFPRSRKPRSTLRNFRFCLESGCEGNPLQRWPNTLESLQRM